MERKPELVRLGTALRWFRERKGLSQEELAAQADLHRTYIGGVERGERNASYISIHRILSSLHVSWSEFADRLEHIRK